MLVFFFFFIAPAVRVLHARRCSLRRSRPAMLLGRRAQALARAPFSLSMSSCNRLVLVSLKFAKIGRDHFGAAFPRYSWMRVAHVSNLGFVRGAVRWTI